MSHAEVGRHRHVFVLGLLREIPFVAFWVISRSFYIGWLVVCFQLSRCSSLQR